MNPNGRRMKRHEKIWHSIQEEENIRKLQTQHSRTCLAIAATHSRGCLNLIHVWSMCDSSTKAESVTGATTPWTWIRWNLWCSRRHIITSFVHARSLDRGHPGAPGEHTCDHWEHSNSGGHYTRFRFESIQCHNLTVACLENATCA